jgi:beta-glucanase (GH16 family)
VLILLPIIFCISCVSTETGNLSKISPPKIFTISAPAAGNYPQGLYKYPFKEGSTQTELFTQTLVWSPAVSKTFAVNTQYTATLTLDPVNKQNTFAGTDITDISGLPADGVENISVETKGRSLVIKILFEKTAGENAQAQIIFYDDFDGDSLDKTKWELCPEWVRQDRSSWKDDMVSVSGGNLVIKFRNDPSIAPADVNGKSVTGTQKANWLRSGGIRTLTKNYTPIFENGYGYYEARIKFPVVRGTWGAFWLMSRTQQFTTDEGVDGTEIDIVESIRNERGEYNAAYHWNGYGSNYKGVGSKELGGTRPVNVYDGEFHTFSLDWSPSEYIFYVDGIEFWRSDGGSRFKNSGINQNPNYIKLSVESADWAGLLPADFTGDEMLVDYVRVYNQPKSK